MPVGDDFSLPSRRKPRLPVELERALASSPPQSPEVERVYTAPMPPAKPPIGVIDTLFWTLVLQVANILTGIVVVAIYVLVGTGTRSGRHLAADLKSDPIAPALCMIIAAPVLFGFIAWILRRYTRESATDYLHVFWPGLRKLMLWFAALIVFPLAAGLLMAFLGLKPQASGHWQSFVSFADTSLLFWFSVVIFAPLSEGLVFRGFLYEGISRSKFGPHCAVFASALAWAILHVQYNLALVTVIFFLGVLLGYSRKHTDSLVTPFVLHAFWNLLVSVVRTFVQ